MAAALGLTAALVIPAAASADTGGGKEFSGATITFGAISVSGKLIARVTVNLTCDPLDSLDPDTLEPTTTTAGVVGYLPIQLLQAQGRTIDVGFGEVDSVNVVCDGTTINKLVVPVLAQNAPWHGGAALASGGVVVFEASGIGQDSASVDMVSVRLSAK